MTALLSKIKLKISFYANIERIANAKFEPTNDGNFIQLTFDVLRCRIMTHFISEKTFIIKGKVMKFYDVAGQKDKRSKWAPYFDNMHCMIFVISLSAFDQSCVEDDETNRLIESFACFDGLAKNKVLDNVPTIILLVYSSNNVRTKLICLLRNSRL
jgi:hypothetical protein